MNPKEETNRRRCKKHNPHLDKSDTKKERERQKPEWTLLFFPNLRVLGQFTSTRSKNQPRKVFGKLQQETPQKVLATNPAHDKIAQGKNETKTKRQSLPRPPYQAKKYFVRGQRLLLQAFSTRTKKCSKQEVSLAGHSQKKNTQIVEVLRG
jgi:hypothetical protein